jgi:hypothetical protein
VSKPLVSHTLISSALRKADAAWQAVVREDILPLALGYVTRSGRAQVVKWEAKWANTINVVVLQHVYLPHSEKKECHYNASDSRIINTLITVTEGV